MEVHSETSVSEDGRQWCQFLTGVWVHFQPGQMVLPITVIDVKKLRTSSLEGEDTLLKNAVKLETMLIGREESLELRETLTVLRDAHGGAEMERQLREPGR